MSRKARHRQMLDKAQEAAIAAISCYNQPNFSYREESFCILMVNAWELLLKAKIVKNNNEDLKKIYKVDKDAKRKDGKPYAKPKYIRSKSGNFVTIDFKKALARNQLDNMLKKQLTILYELRNSSIHLAEGGLQKTSLEVFTATLQSFCLLCEQWFDKQTTDNLMLIPLAFDVPQQFTTNITNKEAHNLLSFISSQENDSSENSNHSIRVNIEVKLERKEKGVSVHQVQEGGITVTYNSEEKFQKTYPWTYTENLIPTLLDRYNNFRQNLAFRRLMNKLKKDPKYCGERYLDWNKKSGTKKDFYSPNIITVIAKDLGLLSRPTLKENSLNKL